MHFKCVKTLNENRLRMKMNVSDSAAKIIRKQKNQNKMLFSICQMYI